jgi:uncharacterized membrane protein
MNFETTKTLGGIGALLLFVAVIAGFLVPYSVLILGAIGLILVLVALHSLADYYHDHSIFSNALYSFVAVIVGVITAVGVIVGTVLINYDKLRAFIYQIYPGWNGDWSSLQTMTPDTNAIQSGNIDYSVIVPILIGILAFAVIVWVFAIIATFFIRKSLKTVSDKSTVGLFGTAGLLMLIGAVLIIALGLGILLVWIGTLILAIAFFQLSPLSSAPVYEEAQAPPPATII